MTSSRHPAVHWTQLDDEVLCWLDGAVHRLDPSATLVWLLLDDAATDDELAATLATATGAPREQMAADSVVDNAEEAAYRIEHDTMGEVRVPINALWRAQTQRAVENFPISFRPLERTQIRALGLLKGDYAAGDAVVVDAQPGEPPALTFTRTRAAAPPPAEEEAPAGVA